MIRIKKNIKKSFFTMEENNFKILVLKKAKNINLLVTNLLFKKKKASCSLWVILLIKKTKILISIIPKWIEEKWIKRKIQKENKNKNCLQSIPYDYIELIVVFYKILGYKSIYKTRSLQSLKNLYKVRLIKLWTKIRNLKNTDIVIFNGLSFAEIFLIKYVILIVFRIFLHFYL